jgi:prophage tail gpP-like protein
MTENAVTLSLDGQIYGGWKDVSIHRSLDSLVGRFALGLSARETTGAKNWPLRAGASCKVAIDDHVLIDGRIDRLAPSIDAESHDIVISGRDRAADLVDASAIHKSGLWRGVKLEEIVRELVAPFEIAIEFSGDTGDKIKRFALQQGESVWAAIERLCRMRGFIGWSLASGIRIGNPGTGAVVATLEEGQNILSGSAVHDVTERFGEYIVKGQASADDETNGRSVSAVSAKAQDPGIKRHRPLIIIAEDQANKALLQKRADWEANVRAARSQPATVTLAGWKNDSGQLWSIDNLVKLLAPSLYISSDMLVAGLTFERSDDRGTVVDLTLERPEAYSQEPVSPDANSSAIGDG